MHTSRCTSTIETAVYENRTYGGVRGRRLVTASYSIEDPEFLAAGICGKGIAEKRVKSISKLAIDVDLTDNIIRKYFYQQNAGVFRSCVLCRAGAAPAENGEY